MGAPRTITCYRCGRTDARRADDGVPRDWATAVVRTGPDEQRVVYVCPACPLPADTLNRQPEHRHA